MFNWVCAEASKLGMVIIIGRYHSSFYKRPTFVRMKYDIYGEYKKYIPKLKCDDLLSCAGTTRQKNVWKFNMLHNVHSHRLDHKLSNHPTAIRLDCDENKFFAKMTMKMVMPKNILTTLKRKRPDNV